MSKPVPRICLIAPGHVSSTPRLVKNADALANAGYRVRVVVARTFPPAEPLDEEIFAAARWPHRVVDQLRGGVLFRGFARRLARRLITASPFASFGNAVRVHNAGIRRLAAAAAEQPADLYLGHCLAGLPAAALAARRHGVPYGFDAEDFHDGETAEAMADPAERTARGILQKTLLPGCAHLTAASPLIAERYRSGYGVRPAVLLNVFPRSHAPSARIDPGPITSARPARFYWFSQTVGPGRGLETIVAVIGRMRRPVELQLRGFPVPGYADHLRRLARAANVKRPIQFLSPGPPAEMARLAAAADVGLSLEERQPLNRDVCLTNKIFIYLLAGIPQLLSNTSAQAAFATEIGAAGLTGDLDKPEEIASRLDSFLDEPGRVSSARRTAWDLAQSRYCWEVEQEVLLRSVEKIVGPAR